MTKETAMKILKELHDKSLFAERTAIETIIPELKNEDEKIRNALIRFHKSTIDVDGIEGADILTWLEKQGKSSDQIHYWTEEEIEPIINDYLRGVEHYGGMIGRLRCLKPKSLEKQGKVPVTINVDKMVRNYANNKECGNEGFGKPINCMIRAYRQGIMDTLEKQVNCSVKWQKNTPDNKPTIRHSVLMKTIQGIAEGEWQGEYWFQYRWSWTLKDSDVLAWMELSDLDEQGEQKPIVDFKAKDWYVSKVDGKIHDMTYNPTDKVVIKKGEKFTTWSDEDEENLQHCCMAISADGLHTYEDKQEMETWLKSLKDRVQPKQVCGVEDEKHILSIEQVLNCADLLNVVPEKINVLKDWLKSLKDRIGG